jgi:hypothetical protein
MRSWTCLAALLLVTGLGCASDDPREHVVEMAGPQLHEVERVIVATMHEGDTETPFDFEGSFAGSLSPGTIGSPDISGGPGSPTLGGGTGSTSFSGGVGGRTGVPGGGAALFPSASGFVDLAFVDAVCDLFYGVCLWVERCDDSTLTGICESFPTEECRQFVSLLFFEAGITAVPPQVTAAVQCFADRFPTLSCDTSSAEAIYPICIPGYVPPPSDFAQ